MRFDTENAHPLPLRKVLRNLARMIVPPLENVAENVFADTALERLGGIFGRGLAAVGGFFRPALGL